MSRTSRHFLDVAALYEAVERARVGAGSPERPEFSWRSLAAELGIDKQVFFRLRNGEGMDVDALVSILAWLDRPLEEFVRTDRACRS